MQAYGEALIEQAQREPRLVALDADCVLDTGLVDFRERFPDRFFECGIAEQDMVSQAGAMASAGCRRSATRSPASSPPGPTSRSTTTRPRGRRWSTSARSPGSCPAARALPPVGRDISALGGGAGHVPDRAVLRGGGARGGRVGRAPGAGLRLSPARHRAVGARLRTPDRPSSCRAGDGAARRAGPAVRRRGAGDVPQAWQAAELLAATASTRASSRCPWLRGVDRAWLAEVAGDAPIVCLDNHYVAGGQGEAVLARSPRGAGGGARVSQDRRRRVPKSGENNEVLHAHGLDAEGIVASVRLRLQALEPSA